MSTDPVHGARAAARIGSFAPVSRPDASILILGSMPGVASLRAREYYAHPQNQFWRIMGELYGAVPALAHADRLAALLQHRVALWDVLQSCVRVGSLDAAIDAELPNDLPAFLRLHPVIVRVCCNGGHSHSALRRHFGAALARDFPHLEHCRLPSTSAANASVPYGRKLAAWRAALAGP